MAFGTNPFVVLSYLCARRCFWRDRLLLLGTTNRFAFVTGALSLVVETRLTIGLLTKAAAAAIAPMELALHRK